MTNDASSFEEIKKWKTLGSKRALDEPWFPVRKDQIELPSGTVIGDYYVWESPNYATVVPLTEDGKFVLVEQYRHAVSKIMLQFPAGGIGKNEDPATAALRELEEETGYVTKDIELLGESSAHPTKITGWHHLFLAKDVQLTGTSQEDENEPTRVELKTPEELWELILSNQFQVADSMAAALIAFRRLGL